MEMAKYSLEVGDRLVDRTTPLIEAEVIGVSEHIGLRHYAFRVTTPGTAPRELSLSESGAFIKFSADSRTKNKKRQDIPGKE
jgi:hypothetical protein